MKVSEPEGGFPRDLGVPEHPSSHAISRLQGRRGQPWPSGKHRGQQADVITLGTHTTPVLGHDGSCRVTLWLLKDPRLESYQAGT